MKKIIGIKLSVAIVILLHGTAFSSLFLMQGCGTGAIEREPSLQPEVVMPPTMSRHTVGDRVALTPVTPKAPSPMKPWIKDTKTYTVASGDTMSAMAKRFGVGVSEILRLNGLTDPNRIRVGQKLVVPAYAKVSAPRTKPTLSTSVAVVSTSAAGGTYSVVSGDTLSGIAQRHGLKTSTLKAHNGLASDMIRVGQKLKVPTGVQLGSQASTRITSKPSVPKTPKVESVVKPVKPVTPPVPVVADPIPSIPDLPTIEDVAVPSATPDVLDEELLDVTTDAGVQGDVHEVKEGEDLYSIAKKWGVFAHDIVTANNLTDPELKPGQKLKIP